MDFGMMISELRPGLGPEESRGFLREGCEGSIEGLISSCLFLKHSQ